MALRKFCDTTALPRMHVYLFRRHVLGWLCPALSGHQCLQGSIEQAVAQVEAFRGSLEHRVIARFDDAVSAGDLGGMSECARIMAEFRQGESQLVQVPRAPLTASLQHRPMSPPHRAVSTCRRLQQISWSQVWVS